MIQARAAVLLRHDDSQQVQFGRLPDEIGRKPSGAIDLRGPRRHRAPGELPDRVPNQPLVVG